MKAPPRRICFVTGTRAEFGLMRTALRSDRRHPDLELQIIATGMHLDPRHGRGVAQLKSEGWNIDATVPWPPANDPTSVAVRTGQATIGLARVYERLESDVVLVVGDRVEAFAAASAAHLSHRILAHVHGGDRALGQLDDSLRHAITKLSHLHFPATKQSANRLERMGEDRWRIHHVGSPGNDGITASAVPWKTLTKNFPALRRRRYALLVLHPTDPDPKIEQARATLLLKLTREAGFEQIVIIHPNNDPGAAGILRAWSSAKSEIVTILPDVPRDLYLSLLANAAALIGNSSSGIIESAAFATPTLDIGPRQAGRERPANVIHSHWSTRKLRRPSTASIPRNAPAAPPKTTPTPATAPAAALLKPLPPCP